MNAPHHNTNNIRQNFFTEFVRPNWQVITGVGLIIVSIINLFFRVGVVERDLTDNKIDIKALDQRVGDVEGDIKAIRQGIDYLIKKQGN